MNWELVKACTVAIATPEGYIQGTGFFISPKGHLLTCAHVVESAGGWEEVRVNGQGVELVYLGDRTRDDFAILQLSGYQGASVPLAFNFQPMDRFLSIGYGRTDFPQGASIDGTITDINPQSEFSNLPMLRLRVKANSQQVQGGYSGSPVFDAETQRVIGIIAAYDNTEGALALPLVTVRQKWSNLSTFLDINQNVSLLSPNSDSARVFISYRSQDPDLSLAQYFYEAIKAAGHEVFMAGESIRLGENWPQRIDTELERCDYFLLLLSPQSATSEMVTEEVRRAKQLQDLRPEHKPVILPIRVNFPLSSPLNYDLRGYLSQIQQREWKSHTDTLRILQEILSLLAVGNSQRLVLSEISAIPVFESPDHPPLPIAEPELYREPGGSVFLKSVLYVERPPIELDCYQEILQPGALIRIKAPRQMGKTSLMSRIIECAREQGYQAMSLSLQRADSVLFTNLEQFLRWFCEQVGRRLKRLNQLEAYWSGSGIKDRCNTYFEECLLEEIDSPLVLGLDEVDLLFSHREVADDFFGLLRSWYESARYGDFSSERWEKLRLVIVHSTEVYVPLNRNQSPFNVGKNVELPEFNSVQVQDLVRRYGLEWRETQIEKLMALVGGYPYLVQKTLYHLRRQDVCLEQLVQTAPTEAGIYAGHLRQHLWTLKKYPPLAEAFLKVLIKNKSVELDTEAAFKLESMGLVKRHGNEWIARCDLYRSYFRDHLKN
ncbi:AAA-like domain-containing protein [Nostoc sp.]|uniref:AAA-like domain-containing protein n=1 Tax=Nostoc sp. TaxID=1180 RepID=UPI002FF9C2C8